VDPHEPTHTTLLKPATVASRLGVSRTWLYEAAKTGRIPSIRIGGEDGPLRFISEDIERWLQDARSAWLPGQTPAATRGSGEATHGLRVVS